MAQPETKEFQANPSPAALPPHSPPRLPSLGSQAEPGAGSAATEKVQSIG